MFDGNGLDLAPEIEGVVLLLTDRAGRIALQLRDDRLDVAYPGYWGLFGGAMECGESAEDAALREVFEEIGVVLVRTNWLGCGTWSILWPHGDTKVRCRVYVFYYPVADELDGAAILEGERFCFMTPAEAGVACIVPPHRDILAAYERGTSKAFLNHLNIPSSET